MGRRRLPALLVLALALVAHLAVATPSGAAPASRPGPVDLVTPPRGIALAPAAAAPMLATAHPAPGKSVHGKGLLDSLNPACIVAPGVCAGADAAKESAKDLALGILGRPGPERTLATFLLDGDPFVRLCAYRSLKQLTGKDVDVDWMYGTLDERRSGAEQYLAWILERK